MKNQENYLAYRMAQGATIAPNKRIIAVGDIKLGEIHLATPEQKLATLEAITSLIGYGDYTRYLQSFSPEAREAAEAIIVAGLEAAVTP